MSDKKFFIAGVQHHDLHKVIKNLSVGDLLDLVPEPTNKYDPNAVRIEYDGTMCGYVPKKFSSEVSAMFEYGDPICIIKTLDPSAKPWEWCEVTITDADSESEESDPDQNDNPDEE